VELTFRRFLVLSILNRYIILRERRRARAGGESFVSCFRGVEYKRITIRKSNLKLGPKSQTNRRLNLISNSTPKTHTQNSLQLQFKLNDTTTIKGMQTLRRTSTPTRTHHQPPPLSEQQAHRKRPTYVYLDTTAWTERSGATRQHTHLLVLVEEGDHVGTVGGLLKAHEGHVRTWVPDRCRRLSTCACLGRQRGGHRAGQRLCRRLDMAQYP